MTEIRPAHVRSDGIRLFQGQEWWEDSPHLLAARIRREVAAGRIAESCRFQLPSGRHGAIINRLKPRPTRRRLMALWTSGGVAIGAAVGASTWWVAVHLEEVLTALLVLGLAAGGLMILTRALLGHRPTCVGIHCPGCRDK